MMADPGPLEPLSLLGGPLHEFGRRLGLVRGSNAVRLGLALGVGWWLVVVALAFVQHRVDQIFVLTVIGAHARLLLVIPLLFIGESWVAPRMAQFVALIARTGVVRDRAALSAVVARTNRLANAWWPEATCLIVAIVLQIARTSLKPYGTTGTYDPSQQSLIALAYFHVGITMFRFLVFRWGWKLALWGWFLWRVSRLDLHLMPGHPDRAGGLGTLAEVHERFIPLVVANSILESASLAESISTGALSTSGVYPWLMIVLLIDAVLFLGPLTVFTGKLWVCHTTGVWRYTDLASRYVSEFEEKWTGRNAAGGEPLLGTADIQSLADLANTFGVVKEMRWIAAGPRLLTMMAIAALVPFLPLLLFEYPIPELTKKFLSMLVGL